MRPTGLAGNCWQAAKRSSQSEKMNANQLLHTFFALPPSCSLPLSVSHSSLSFCLSLGSALYINDTFANTVAQRKSLCVYGFVCLPLPFYPPSLLLPFSARLPATFGVHFALVFVCFAWAAVPHFIIHNDWYTRWLQRTQREAARLMCTHLSAGRGKGETRKSVVGHDWQRQRLKVCNAKYRHS